MSSKLHFFKAPSRLGLRNPPVYASTPNIGVEDAPDVILSKQFLKHFPGSRVSEYAFSDPEVKNYWQVLARDLAGFKDFINGSLKPGQTQIVVGGDNSVTFSSLLAVEKRIKNPEKLGYIQFDSHGECNKCATSPSGNFHGMYMRPFYSQDFEIEEINLLVKFKIPVGNIICFGNLDLDGDEPEFFKAAKIRVINRQEVLSKKEKVKKELQSFISRFEHIHINFDVDVMDKSVTPATGIPTQSGFHPEDINPILQIIRHHPSRSLDLVEVNPRKQGAGKTVKFARDIVKYVCGYN